MSSKNYRITVLALGLFLVVGALLYGMRQTSGDGADTEVAPSRDISDRQSGVEQVRDAAAVVGPAESPSDCGKLFTEAAQLSAIDPKHVSELL